MALRPFGRAQGRLRSGQAGQAFDWASFDKPLVSLILGPKDPGLCPRDKVLRTSLRTGRGEQADTPPVEVIDCPACRPV